MGIYFHFAYLPIKDMLILNFLAELKIKCYLILLNFY